MSVLRTGVSGKAKPAAGQSAIKATDNLIYTKYQCGMTCWYGAMCKPCVHFGYPKARYCESELCPERTRKCCMEKAAEAEREDREAIPEIMAEFMKVKNPKLREIALSFMNA